MRTTPFDDIQKSLSGSIPQRCIDLLPRKWEKIGNVCILRFDDELEPYVHSIGETYASVLGCKSVLHDVGGIEGAFRIPQVKLIFGDENTETVHKENGVEFLIDPSRVMYSSGNLDERKRMSTIADQDEVVVDMFAGIGYFSIPMAVHSKPKKIYACEINPVAYEYLCKNITLNDVTAVIEPCYGNSLVVAPEDVADRVVMGYVGDTHRFFQKALLCLKDLRGMIHFHDTFPDTQVPDKPMMDLKSVSDSIGRDLVLIKYIRVKSYAPGISHYVFDMRVG